MPRRQNESISIKPRWVLGVMLKMLCPERVSHRRATHWHSRVATVRFLNTIDREAANRIDAESLNIC